MNTTDTRSRLIDSALGLFAFEGYEVTSLVQVCEQADANPGSLYYFFRTKEQLLEAVLDHLHERLEPDLLAHAWKGVDDPVDRIFALLHLYRENLLRTDLKYGCPIGNLALEWRDPPEGVRKRLAKNFQAWAGAVHDCLEEAEDRLPPEADLDALATFVLTTMEGGVMLARTERAIRPFDQSVQCLREYFHAIGVLVV